MFSSNGARYIIKTKQIGRTVEGFTSILGRYFWDVHTFTQIIGA